MRGKRTWSGAVWVLCLSTAACSSDQTGSPPSAARDVSPPPATAQVQPQATPASGAAGSVSPDTSASPPKASNTGAKSMVMEPAMEPAAASEPKPFDGLPVGPAAPQQPDVGGQVIAKVIPRDARAVSTVAKLPPISGGTLAITSDDRYAIASDPDRDRVSIVDLVFQRVLSTIALNPGDEPGRVALDGANRAHVALRRGGAIVSIDLATRSIVERRDVCAAPRGVEVDAARSKLIVACQSGELVTLPLSGTQGVVRQTIAQDIRDVVPVTNGLLVSRFKSAELLSVAADGAVAAKSQPAAIRQIFPELDGSQSIDTLDPVGARRVRLAADGSVVMLHQTAREGDISLDSEQHGTNPMINVPTASPYGGAGSCSGVAGTAITTFDTTGKVVSTVQLSMGTLAVDVAQAHNSKEIAVATAGAFDPFQPQVGFVSASTPEEAKAIAAGAAPPPPPMVVAEMIPPNGDMASNIVTAVVRYDLSQSSVDAFSGKAIDSNGLPQAKLASAPPCIGMIAPVMLPSPATAVAFMADDRLVVQTREPAALFIAQSLQTNDGSAPIRIDLAGASMLDTGHEIFHRDAGAGVACATCHLEGDEDGHTWHFAGQGPRRTQALSVGLEGTAPFHWVGDMEDLGKLMENVFVSRMGGVHQSDERLNALARWMFSIQAPKPLRAATDPAVARGHELFVGQAECSKCHDGAKLTNNQTVDVGTGLALQVPSLIGVGLRGPWIHTGCAKTLQQRFDPACGGNAHGKTATLTPAQIDDLVAYLESL
jgi:mono/diheme cytochrome c family protein